MEYYPARPFTGVTDGTTIPLGQVRLDVMFGTRQNYHTESLDFDVAHLALPYNAILGYPALAKFMVVTHHTYNMVKLPGRDGIITVRGGCGGRGATRPLRPQAIHLNSHKIQSHDDGSPISGR